VISNAMSVFQTWVQLVASICITKVMSRKDKEFWISTVILLSSIVITLVFILGIYKLNA
jgi:hypothetical protein